MRSSPYRAGLAGRHHKRLPMSPALLACYGPVWLSPPGKLLTQEPIFRTPPLSERDLTLGDTAHVVRVPDVLDPDEVRVVHVDGGDAPDLSNQSAKLFGAGLPPFAEALPLCREFPMEGVVALLCALFQAFPYLRDLAVKFVEIHVGEDRTCHPSHNVAKSWDQGLK